MGTVRDRFGGLGRFKGELRCNGWVKCNYKRNYRYNYKLQQIQVQCKKMYVHNKCIVSNY